MTNTPTDMSRLDEEYEAPVKKWWAYFKPSETKTKIRIMGRPITGWIDRQDKQPTRTKEKPTSNYDNARPAKHFWAMVIWNYVKEQFEIREITQATIREQLTILKDWDWGNPVKYDLVVHKEWKDLDTKYFVSTTPSGITPVAQEVNDKFINMTIDLNELYTGWNPFAPEAKF